MRRMDVYFHDGCLSEPAILLLARDIARDCPTWEIAVHPLLDHEAKALGLAVLPAIVLNGRPAATGIPKKDWLLEKMHECESAER